MPTFVFVRRFRQGNNACWLLESEETFPARVPNLPPLASLSKGNARRLQLLGLPKWDYERSLFRGIRLFNSFWKISTELIEIETRRNKNGIWKFNRTFAERLKNYTKKEKSQRVMFQEATKEIRLALLRSRRCPASCQRTLSRKSVSALSVEGYRHPQSSATKHQDCWRRADNYPGLCDTAEIIKSPKIPTIIMMVGLQRC